LQLDGERNRLLVIMMVLLTAILAAAFFAIRYILRPMKWLNTGGQEVGQGNLKHRLPLKNADEFCDLAAAFNDMSARIEDMLQTKDQLLLDISHELRTPITRMKVALEFLTESRARKSLQAGIVEMEKMVGGILETARLRHKYAELKKQPTDLVALLKQTAAAFGKQPPGIVAVDLPQEIILQVDPHQIKTVFESLLSNAFKCCEPGSDPVKISVPYFEPFYRVDQSRSKDTGGYGLGLSLCKTIMDAHEGKIEVQSRLKEGTTGLLFFPYTKS
jgi:signal transduction histidine kinase